MHPWLTSDWLNRHWGSDLIISWPVESLEVARLNYPLNPVPLPSPAEIYYEIQLHLCNDYVYRSSEVVEPFENTNCPCGEPLEFWPDDDRVFYAARLMTTCPNCKRPFDPSTLPSLVVDAWTGDQGEIQGGCTYRFALAVDCGKCIPRDEWRPQLNPDFRQLCQEDLDCTFREIDEYY